MQIEHHLLTNNLTSELEASLCPKQPLCIYFWGRVPKSICTSNVICLKISVDILRSFIKTV